MKFDAIRGALAIAVIAVAIPAAHAQQCPATVPAEGAVPPAPLPVSFSKKDFIIFTRKKGFINNLLYLKT
jgi:hypothetical protein